MPKQRPTMATRRRSTPSVRSGTSSERSLRRQFSEVADTIRNGKAEAVRHVNTTLIDTYWRVGGYISAKVESAEWGTGVVAQLAAYLHNVMPDPRGFSDKNLWRMMQFHDLYRDYKKLSTVLRELPWSSHLHIMSKTKTPQERSFYVDLAIRERYTVRELERAIDSRMYERTDMVPAKLSTSLRVLHPAAERAFRDSYTFDFLGLSQGHTEFELRKAIVGNLKMFILEFGRDFAFVGEEYRVQVGMKDSSIDLLFYNRALCCLVAIELKIEEFKPEHLGKLSFYLEALDRDVRKPNENPSIGIILCKGKDRDVVEYALARTTSPAAIADYETRLPDKNLLMDKLQEFFDSSMREIRAGYGDGFGGG